MTAADATLTELAAVVERARNVLDTMAAAVASGDALTARYAAASLAMLSDQAETALLAVDREARSIATQARHLATRRAVMACQPHRGHPDTCP